MSDAAADEVQLLRWLDLRRERISALEASMAVSVETEPTDRWVPAEDADVWPNEANGEDQLEPVRMEPAAEDPDVPCRGNNPMAYCNMEGMEFYLNSLKMTESVLYLKEEA